MDPILYWALAILAAIVYGGLAILVGRCLGLNDQGEDQ